MHARLMLVVAALGDKTGALQIFAEVRGRLAEELGVVPGDELREAHRRVLRGDTRARPAVATVTAPAQVPAGVQTFTGRAGLLAQLDALLEGRDRPDTSAGPTVCLVTGPAGVGKSTLATVWAHRVRAHFPAGQLYVDLRGHAPTSGAAAGRGAGAAAARPRHPA